MNWNTLEGIKESINRLDNDKDVTDNSPVTIRLNGKRLDIHSIGLSKDGDIIIDFDEVSK